MLQKIRNNKKHIAIVSLFVIFFAAGFFAVFGGGLLKTKAYTDPNTYWPPGCSSATCGKQFFAGTSSGGGSTSYTFTVPTGATTVGVTMSGGGGRGGGGNQGSSTCGISGGGGGGGGDAVLFQAVSISSGIITVMAGNGSSWGGGTSSFGSFVSVGGGDNGADGCSSYGAGGSGNGSGSAGGNGGYLNGGNGGNSLFGTGGAGGSGIWVAGTNASGYGAGGGGGGAPVNGGIGAPGFVAVYYKCNSGYNWNGSLCVAPTYAITAATPTNGTLTPTGVTNVNSGSNQTYTITPSSGYYIASVLVDGVSQGAITTYTFVNVLATHTISATFSSQYTLTVNAGAGGTAIGGGSGNLNDNKTLTATPNPGYVFNGWYIISGPGSLTTNYMATPANFKFGAGSATVNALFNPQTYSLTVEGGTADPASSYPPYPIGTYVLGQINNVETITATNISGSSFSYWTITGPGTLSSTTTNPTTFTFGTGNADVQAHFVNNNGTIKVNSNIANVTIGVNPYGYYTTVVTPNIPVTAAPGAPIGVYTATCPVISGYTWPMPPSQILTTGSTITFTCTYVSNTVGTINVNSNIANTIVTVSPGSYSGTVATANTAVAATTTAPAGTYTATCPDDKAGYTITQPASQTLTASGSITFTCNYTAVAVPTAFLKDLGYTTAETLLFTPSTDPNGKKIKQWSLLDGVGEISIAGNNTWQKSSAEVLYVGTMAVANITKTSDSHYVIAGSSATYKIHFDAELTKNQQYAATVVDTITVTDPSQYSEVSIDSTGTIIKPNAIDSICGPKPPPSTDLGIPIWGSIVIDDTSKPKKVTFSLPTATMGCSFELLVKLNFTDKILSNTVVHDEAKITLPAEGASALVTYDTLAVGPFTQETVGGDIYSKGNLNFGQVPSSQYGAKYVFGADGTVQKTSESGWTLGSYGIRSGTTDDFNPDACTVSGSACKVMNDNIARLEKLKTNISPNNINGTFDLNPSNLPEGGAFYYNGNSVSNLTIGGPTVFKGRGTIIVENANLIINGNMTYNDTSKTSKDMLGIIVKNGNVVVSGDPLVTNVSGIFYIFSDQAPPNGNPRGQFIVNANLSGDDSQFILNGAVIASGYYDSTAVPPALKRKDAFVLARRYAGDPNVLKNYTTTNPGVPIPDNLLNPAELFLFDSRIIVMPPPGFEGKIVGSM